MSDETDWKRRINEQLDSCRVTLGFVHRHWVWTTAKAIYDFQTQTKVNIVLDQAAIDRHGGIALPLRMQNVPLREALARIFEYRSTLAKRRSQRAGYTVRLGVDEISYILVDEAVFISVDERIDEALKLSASHRRAPLRADVSTAERELHEKLGRKTTVELVAVPLDEAVDFVKRKDVTGVNVVVDPRAVDAEGTKDIKITLRVFDMRVEYALAWVGRMAGLDYELRDGKFFFSTPEILRADRGRGAGL